MPAKNAKTKTAKRPAGYASLRRRRVSISFPEQGLTKQSFRDECDINKIVDQFARTGVINNLPRGEPQYGDAPEQSFFESACISAEIASKTELDPEFGKPAESDSEASEEPSDASEANAENPAPQDAQLPIEGSE